MKYGATKDGFTLIELLVVIAIIGLLSSVVLASLSSARAKARDAKRIADFASIQMALQLYFDKHHAMPPNHTPGTETYDNDPTFLSEVIADGFLGGIPHDPSSPSIRYAYYNYNSGNAIGALLVTTLEAAPLSTTGIPPSCRPWALGTNWCDLRNTRQYCLCTPY